MVYPVRWVEQAVLFPESLQKRFSQFEIRRAAHHQVRGPLHQVLEKLNGGHVWNGFNIPATNLIFNCLFKSFVWDPPSQTPPTDGSMHGPASIGVWAILSFCYLALAQQLGSSSIGQSLQSRRWNLSEMVEVNAVWLFRTSPLLNVKLGS